MRAIAQKSLITASLVLASTALTGCNNRLKDENAMLLSENTALRERNAQLETALNTVESQRSALQAEVHELDRLLAQARTTQSEPQNRSTGFEGIGGVSGIDARNGELVVGVAGDVLFSSGSATLRKDAQSTLSRIASVIKRQYAGKRIRVEGHTDSDPIKKSGWKTNERLSGERAMAVEEYLVSQGISADQIYFAGFGPAHPKTTKKDSRRVEIVIIADDR